MEQCRSRIPRSSAGVAVDGAHVDSGIAGPHGERDTSGLVDERHPAAVVPRSVIAPVAGQVEGVCALPSPSQRAWAALSIVTLTSSVPTTRTPPWVVMTRRLPSARAAFSNYPPCSLWTAPSGGRSSPWAQAVSAKRKQRTPGAGRPATMTGLPPKVRTARSVPRCLRGVRVPGGGHEAWEQRKSVSGSAELVIQTVVQLNR